MHYYIIGLGFCTFARHYLRNHFCFLLLWVLRCFSSPRSLSKFMEWHSFTMPGFPIRTSWDQRLFAPPPSFSQLITSFIASQSLGIHRSLLFCLFYSFCSLLLNKFKINIAINTLSYCIAFLLLYFLSFQYVKDLLWLTIYSFTIYFPPFPNGL